MTPVGRDAARARESARMARAGVWSRVTPEDAESYAQDRLEDAAIIERVYLTPEAEHGDA